MRVLLVSEPGHSGVFRHVQGLAQHLLRTGEQPALAWSSRRPCAELLDLVEEMKGSGAPTLDLAVGNGPELRDLPALGRLERLIRSFRPEIIHAHSSKAGGLVRLRASMPGLAGKLFYTPHAYYRMHDPADSRARVFHAVERILGRLGTTINVSHSEAEFARRVLGIPETHQRIVHNGVDPERFVPATPEGRRAAREELGLPQDAWVVGTVGRLSLQKDPLTFYQALARAKRDVPTLFALHVGQGELETNVENFIDHEGMRSWVRRIPELRDPRPAYRAMDAFALTSRFEGLPFVALEALAMDLAMVLSRCPGVDELAAFGLSHVWWAPPGAADEFAQQFVRAAQSAGQSGASNHRAVAVQEFSESACFGRLVSVYREG